jgi:hypothetical protein
MAQTEEYKPHSSIGLNVGYFFPQGEWNQNRIEPSVDQFRKGLSFEGDLEIIVWDWWAIAFSMGYTDLDVSDWEKHCASTDDTIKASARIFYFGMSIRPYLMGSSTFNVKGQLGLGYFFLSGKETSEIASGEYDFLKSQFGLTGGLEFCQYVNDYAALTLRISCYIIPAGVDYADGEKTNNIYGLPVTLGLRFNL